MNPDAVHGQHVFLCGKCTRLNSRALSTQEKHTTEIEDRSCKLACLGLRTTQLRALRKIVVDIPSLHDISCARERIRRDTYNTALLFPPETCDGFFFPPKDIIADFLSNRGRELMRCTQRFDMERVSIAPDRSAVRINTLIRLSIDATRLSPNCSAVLGFFSFPLLEYPQQHGNHVLFLAFQGSDSRTSLGKLYVILSQILELEFEFEIIIDDRHVKFCLQLIIGGDLSFLSKFLPPEASLYHCPYCPHCRVNRRRISMKEEIEKEIEGTCFCRMGGTSLLDGVPRIICSLHMRTRIVEWFCVLVDSIAEYFRGKRRVLEEQFRHLNIHFTRQPGHASMTGTAAKRVLWDGDFILKVFYDQRGTENEPPVRSLRRIYLNLRTLDQVVQATKLPDIAEDREGRVGPVLDKVERTAESLKTQTRILLSRKDCKHLPDYVHLVVFHLRDIVQHFGDLGRYNQEGTEGLNEEFRHFWKLASFGKRLPSAMRMWNQETEPVLSTQRSSKTFQLLDAAAFLRESQRLKFEVQEARTGDEEQHRLH